MRTTMVMAKNLHAGMYLVENKKGRRVGLHICEVHVDRRSVMIRVNENNGFGERRYKRTIPVKVTR